MLPLVMMVNTSSDRTARVWTKDGQLLSVLRGHKHSVLKAVFSPDGEQIATCSADFTARLWYTRIEL